MIEDAVRAWLAVMAAPLLGMIEQPFMLRDLVATGFWSSKMGVADIGYMGNVPAIWNGAPEEVLKKLGVKYEN